MTEMAEPVYRDVEQGDITLYEDLVDYFNFKPVEQQLPAKPKSITFVTTGVIRFDGGQTTMLHLGTALQKAGYDVYYLSYRPQSEDSMRRNAQGNYADVQGEFLDMTHLGEHQSDIWIATLWESAYVIKDFPGYKMYFVQDYEPYFYPFGDQSILARKTYEMGLHMVSLGEWNKQKIQELAQPVGQLESIDFPGDTSGYAFKTRDFSQYATQDKLRFAIYTKTPSPRRAPIVAQLFARELQTALREHDIDSDFYFFGSDQSDPVIVGENLGKLDKKALNELYQKVDFGLVPSMTNLSLIPYEMMATGLPVIDFVEGSGPAFFAPDSVIETEIDATKLAKVLARLVEKPAELAQLTQRAKSHLQDVSWEKTISQFLTILDQLVVTDADQTTTVQGVK